jgi:hypothetical protein
MQDQHHRDVARSRQRWDPGIGGGTADGGPTLSLEAPPLSPACHLAVEPGSADTEHGRTDAVSWEQGGRCWRRLLPHALGDSAPLVDARSSPSSSTAEAAATTPTLTRNGRAATDAATTAAAARECKDVLLNFKDATGKVWSRPVKEKGLHAGDVVGFYRSASTRPWRLELQRRRRARTACGGVRGCRR